MSEALGVTQDRVRFLKREIMIDRQQEQRAPYALVPLKNSRSTPYRVVPVPQFVIDTFSALDPYGDEHRLFQRPSAPGQPITMRHVNEAITKAVEAAKLPSVTFHALRHFYASTLIDAGESVVVVAARLGDTTAEALKTYAHLFPDDAERTRSIMDGVFEDRLEDRADSVRTVRAVGS